MQLKNMDDTLALRKKAHVSRMSVSENNPTWAKKNMIWSLWPSMIQFNPPNHVQKTNQKNLHISAGKHPFDTSEVLQVRQLLCLKSQTSEHGTKGSFITSDLRAIDVEVIPQRREILQGRPVSDHIGVGEVENFQLREILQSLNVSGDLGVAEVECLQLREILQSPQVAGDLGLGEEELLQLPEILQRLNVTRDRGFSEVEVLQVWQFAEARTQGAGDILAPMQIDRVHFAAIPRLRDPPTWSKVPRKSSLLTDFYRKFCCVWKIIQFYFSIFPKVGYSYPQKKSRQKLSKELPLCRLSLQRTTPLIWRKSLSFDSLNPIVSKTSFNGSSWRHGSTACIDLPRTFTASLKQRYKDDYKVVDFHDLLGGHVMVCYNS